jgi:myosin-5
LRVFHPLSTLQTDLEEAKKQESAKAQSSLEELQLKCKETEALLIKEREAAKKIAETAPIIKEIPVVDQELMDKITNENEKLKVCENF